MRAVFLLILLAGAAVGVGYPWYATNFSGKEIGVFTAYENGAGFQPVDVGLSGADAPVRVLVDLTAVGTPVFDATRAVLTLVVSSDGKTVLADTLSFENATSPRQVSPQSPDRVFRAEAGVIDPVSAGSYSFTLGPGDADAIQMRRADIVLRSDAAVLDTRAQPLGFVLMAVGFVGFVAFRRRRGDPPPTNPNSQPPPPRWGRGAGR